MAPAHKHAADTTGTSHVTPALMFLGTSSDCGKSIMAAAFCRLLMQRGVRVAPFKAQNMALNAGVTPDGLEIGRAQVVQAEAAGLEPHVDMNPILLKPTSDRGSQIIVHGRVAGNMNAASYYRHKKEFWPQVTASYDRLACAFDTIVLEGAGSPVEMNLKHHDIVNMAMAAHADARVVLVADIDRGGVFASILGTMELLTPDERSRIIGYIINKFRGDIALFDEAHSILLEKTGRPLLGVMPLLPGLYIPGEDSVALDGRKPCTTPIPEAVRAAVLRLPYMANYTDFDPLDCDPRFSLEYIRDNRNLEGYNLVIIPGSKNVCADYRFLERSGLSDRLRAYHAGSGRILGICGGFQMLGRSLDDPLGLEGAPQHISTMGLLAVDSVLENDKVTERTQCRLRFPGLANDAEAHGYEIHMGRTRSVDEKALIMLAPEDDRAERIGVASVDGRVIGTYIHGLFDADGVRDALLGWITGAREPAHPGAFSYRDFKENNYDLLARAVEQHVDVDTVLKALHAGR